MEDKHESVVKPTVSITSVKEEETNTPGEPPMIEAGLLAQVKAEQADIDEDSATEDFQEFLREHLTVEEDHGSTDVDMTEQAQMEVNHDYVHVMENDLAGAPVPMFKGDETCSKTDPLAIPNNPVEEKDHSTVTDAEMSSEETVSSSSFASPRSGFFEPIEKSENPNIRVSVSRSSDSDCKSGLKNAIKVNELEEQVKSLQDLLVLKEKEWNVILRLKKHTEFALEHVKHGQRLAKAQAEFNGNEATTDDDKKTWMSLVTEKTGTLKNAEQRIKDDTEKLESRCMELEKEFPFEPLTSTPISSPSLPLRNSIKTGEKQSVVATPTTSKTGGSTKSSLKPAPKLPTSKSLAPSPSTALQNQRMNGGAHLQPFMQTLRDIATKNKLKSTAAFKPVRMTGVDRRFRYQKVIDKLKVEANKLRKAANSAGHPTRPEAQQQLARSKFSRQPTVPASCGQPVVVTYSTGERKLVTQQNYRQETLETAVEVPICQGCHAVPSQYMCSICQDQWYCSKECQLSDWGEHSEVCSN